MCGLTELEHSSACGHKVECSCFHHGLARFEQTHIHIFPDTFDAVGADYPGTNSFFLLRSETEGATTSFPEGGHDNFISAIPLPVHPDQQFLAFAIDFYYMDLTALCTESVANHGDVSHGGEFQKDVRTVFENLVFQGEDVRGAFFDKEDFFA